MADSANTFLLVIDDDPCFHEVATFLLTRYGYRVECVAQWPCDVKSPPSVVLLDRNLDDIDSLTLLPAIVRQWPDAPVVLVTAERSVDSVVQSIKAGAFDFVAKPLDESRLVATIAKAVEHHRLLARCHALESERVVETEFEGLIGRSPQVQTVFRTIRNVAPTDVSVMICGESGTGKELAARAIHQRSDRATGPFVAVNMAGLPAELVESTLFGHERGSFTGAEKLLVGLVEEAAGGSLFLDEITEMPIELQPKLLRFLQERTFRRVGGTKDLHANVRVISATNRDPLLAVREGRLRADLYYRINVVPVHLPPLRERDGDVVVLANHFLRLYNTEYKKAFKSFDQEALDKLDAGLWPGNVRQLSHAIERSVILNQGHELTASMIQIEAVDPEDSRSINGASTSTQDSSQEALGGVHPLATREIVPLEELERRAITQAIEICHGSPVEAARRLGISTATIYRRIRTLEQERASK